MLRSPSASVLIPLPPKSPSSVIDKYDTFNPTLARTVERTYYSTVKDKKVRGISNRRVVGAVLILWGILYLGYCAISGGSVKENAGSLRTNTEHVNRDVLIARWDEILDSFPVARKGTTKWFFDQSAMMRGYAELLVIADVLELRKSMNRVDRGRLEALQKLEHETLPIFKRAKGDSLRFDEIVRLPEVVGRKSKRRRGKGIVICASKYQFRFTFHLVANIRRTFMSNLPIEIWNNGQEDIAFSQERAIKSFGGDTSFKNLKDYDFWDIDEAAIDEDRWTLKAFALLASNFDEPMLIDSDTVFLQRPDSLWEDEGYKKTGTLFFHDRLMDFSQDLRPFVDNILGGREPSETLAKSRYWLEEPTKKWKHQMDSGALIMNKTNRNVLLAVLFAAWMNSQDPQEYSATWLFGDKETFWLACESLGVPYYFSTSYGSAIGPLKELGANTTAVIADNILHLDEDSQPLWFNGGLLASKHQEDSAWIEPEFFTLDDGDWMRWSDKKVFPFKHNGTARRLSPQMRGVMEAQIMLAKKLERDYERLMGEGRDTRTRVEE